MVQARWGSNDDGVGDGSIKGTDSGDEADKDENEFSIVDKPQEFFSDDNLDDDEHTGDTFQSQVCITHPLLTIETDMT